jgi:hypothetical protein
MYYRILFTCLAAASLTSSSLASEQPEVSIQIVSTFDYPGTGNSTTPHSINSRGEIVGTYVDSGGVTRGFVRFSNGSFSSPIVEPNDTGNFTFSVSINTARLICGYFVGADTFYHGFFLSGHTYTQYDMTGALSTYLLDVNDVGDFVGSFNDTVTTRQGLAVIGGNSTIISFSGSPFVDANGINGSDQIVGEYYDPAPANTFHGYFRDTNGTLTFPIDFPGSISTTLVGINDGGLMVGRYVDSAGVEHGLLFKRPSTFLSFDYPGASGTSLNGINDSKFISGRYTDGSGIRHGFLARVR